MLGGLPFSRHACRMDTTQLMPTVPRPYLLILLSPLCLLCATLHAEDPVGHAGCSTGSFLELLGTPAGPAGPAGQHQVLGNASAAGAPTVAPALSPAAPAPTAESASPA